MALLDQLPDTPVEPTRPPQELNDVANAAIASGTQQPFPK
jgi:hypothetical protein